MAKHLDIIIAGMDKAGQTHYRCYEELSKSLPIRVFAIIEPEVHERKISRAIFNPRVIDSFESLPGLLTGHFPYLKGFRKPFRSHQQILIDICTPNICHDIMGLSTESFSNPFIVVERSSSLKNSKANYWFSHYPLFLIAENYLYSEVTAHIRTIIQDLRLRPYFMQTNFSKNGIADVLQSQSCPEDSIPHVFEIEMPHQLSLAVLILGDVRAIEKSACYPPRISLDTMPGRIEGLLTLNHVNGAISTHWTSLRSQKVQRLIKIECQKNFTIVGEYSSDAELTGKILVLKENEIVEEFHIYDDSVKRTLEVAVKLHTASILSSSGVLRKNHHIIQEMERIMEEGIATARYCEPRSVLLKVWTQDNNVFPPRGGPEKSMMYLH